MKKLGSIEQYERLKSLLPNLSPENAAKAKVQLADWEGNTASGVPSALSPDPNITSGSAGKAADAAGMGDPLQEDVGQNTGALDAAMGGFLDTIPFLNTQMAERSRYKPVVPPDQADTEALAMGTEYGDATGEQSKYTNGQENPVDPKTAQYILDRNATTEAHPVASFMGAVPGFMLAGPENAVAAGASKLPFIAKMVGSGSKAVRALGSSLVAGATGFEAGLRFNADKQIANRTMQGEDLGEAASNTDLGEAGKAGAFSSMIAAPVGGALSGVASFLGNQSSKFAKETPLGQADAVYRSKGGDPALIGGKEPPVVAELQNEALAGVEGRRGPTAPRTAEDVATQRAAIGVTEGVSNDVAEAAARDAADVKYEMQALEGQTASNHRVAEIALETVQDAQGQAFDRTGVLRKELKNFWGNDWVASEAEAQALRQRDTHSTYVKADDAAKMDLLPQGASNTNGYVVLTPRQISAKELERLNGVLQDLADKGELEAGAYERMNAALKATREDFSLEKEGDWAARKNVRSDEKAKLNTEVQFAGLQPGKVPTPRNRIVPDPPPWERLDAPQKEAVFNRTTNYRAGGKPSEGDAAILKFAQSSGPKAAEDLDSVDVMRAFNILKGKYIGNTGVSAGGGGIHPWMGGVMPWAKVRVLNPAARALAAEPAGPPMTLDALPPKVQSLLMDMRIFGLQGGQAAGKMAAIASKPITQQDFEHLGLLIAAAKAGKTPKSTAQEARK